MISPSVESEYFARAQANIFSYFRKGLSLPLSANENLSIGELQLASCVNELCENAFQEYTTTLGLDPTVIEPIRRGERVKLSGDQRDQIITSITRYQNMVIQPYLDWEHKRNPEYATHITGLYNRGVKQLQEHTYVNIHGPVLLLELNTDALKIFQILPENKNTGGFVWHFPYQDAQSGKWDLTSHILLHVHDWSREPLSNFSLNRYRSSDHEWWHVAEDVWRLTTPLMEKKYGIQIPSVNHDAIVDRLSQVVLDPTEHIERLRVVNELFKYALQPPMDDVSPDEIKAQLFSIQRELCAFIAGGIVGDAFSQSDLQGITYSLVVGYLSCFGTQELWERLLKITYDAGGYRMVSNNELQKLSKHSASMQLLRDAVVSAARLRKKYHINFFRQQARGIQMIVNEFMNPGGYIHDKRKEIEDRFVRCIQVYKKFADFRGDPWATLFELETIPFCDWEEYVIQNGK
jgi:hypothetical protein